MTFYALKNEFKKKKNGRPVSRVLYSLLNPKTKVKNLYHLSCPGITAGVLQPTPPDFLVRWKQGGQPCCTATAAYNQDIHGFATRETYGSRHCCRNRCAFTAPFHPFPALNSSKQGGHFLLRCYPLSKIFPLRSTAPCVARTFLP